MAKSMQPYELVPADHLLEVLGPAVLTSIRDPLGIFSSEYRVLWANKAMAAIHEYQPKDAIGKICYQTFAKRDQPCDGCPMVSVHETGRTQVSEMWHDFPNGVRRWGEVRSYPVRGADRSIVAVVVMVIETTDKKRKFQQQIQYSAFLAQKLKERTKPEQQISLSDGEIALRVKLSRRETEILRLLSEGYTNPQISQLLSVSPNTVKSHVNQIFNKLGVGDRTQAAVLAVRHKLI